MSDWSQSEVVFVQTTLGGSPRAEPLQGRDHNLANDIEPIEESYAKTERNEIWIRRPAGGCLDAVCQRPASFTIDQAIEKLKQGFNK